MLARQSQLVRLCWALTGDRHLAEDLAQTSLDRLWRRWAAVSQKGDAWPYLQRIAVSQAATWRRRRWHHAEAVSGEAPEPVSSAGDVFDAIDGRVDVAAWLARLAPRQRAVVTLRFLFDLSIPEDADLLHCSQGTVKSQTSKALAALRESATKEPHRQHDRGGTR